MFGPIILWFASADYEQTREELIESGKFSTQRILAQEETRQSQRKRLDLTVATLLRRHSIKPALEYDEIGEMAERTTSKEDTRIIQENNEAQGAFFSNPIWQPEALAVWTDEVMPFALPEEQAKQVFEFSIELFMYQQFPAEFNPDSGIANYARFIEDNLCDFYLLYSSVFLSGLYAHLTAGTLEGMKQAVQVEANEELIKYLLGRAKLTPELLENNPSVDAYKKVLDAEVQDYKEQAEAILDDAERELNDVYDELERQKRKNALLEEELKALLRELRVNDEEELSEEEESEVEATAAQLIEAAEETEEELDSIELPRRALFLGGHPNLVKRLSTRFKKWDFVTSKNGGGEIIPDGEFEVVFIWAGHLSHKIMQQVDRDKPIIYLTATNYALLKREMKLGYAKVLKDREQANSN